MNSLSFLSNCSFPVKWRGGVLLLKRQMQKKKKRQIQLPALSAPTPAPLENNILIQRVSGFPLHGILLPHLG